MGLTIGLLVVIALLLAFNYWILSNVKRIVKEKAESSISSLGLDGVLYLLGYHDRHIDMMMEE